MNSHLRAHGFGDLNDKTLLDQLAFMIRTHEKFKEMLMKVEPGERANAYKAIAPRLKFFKPKSLEDYEIEGKREAENLPIYDHKTLAVTEPRDAVMSEEAKQAITGKSLEERQQSKLEETAANAIAESIGQEKARGRLEIFCSKCMFGTTVYGTDRADAYRTLLANGWFISGKHAYCPTCGPTPKDEH